MGITGCCHKQPSSLKRRLTMKRTTGGSSMSVLEKAENPLNLRALIRFLAAALLFAFVADIASAAACPGSVDAWLALGAGSCTQPDGSVVSNFRYEADSASIVPPATSNV